MTIMRQKIIIVKKSALRFAQFCTTGSEFHVLVLRLERRFVKNVCGWRSASHPSPMWPWLDSASCGFISLVFVLCSERFKVFLVTPVFPHLKNQNWFCLTRFGLSWFLVSSLSRALVLGYTSSNYYCYFCRACQMNVPNCRYTALVVRSSF